MTNQVLIIDDEPDIRSLVEMTLGRMNLETRSAANLAEARALLDAYDFDLCLTDMRLPDGSGLDIVRHIQEHSPALPVAVITAYGNMETAVTALKAGAFDFISKPVDINDLRNIVRTALRLSGGKDGIPSPAAGPVAERMLGSSAAMRKVRSMIEKLARGQAPVYISGDSGTGKELAARLIHELGPRASMPFIPVNCGAIPSELMESEFFGHKRGSFTGAVEDKEGLFAAAHGGTLFLDEVGDLPLSMQVKLLRAIQEKCVRPIGGQSELKVDVRILSATHKNLDELVATGRFRQDLYYRLNVIELHIPGLAERAEDIPLLAEEITARLVNDMGIEAPRIEPAAMDALKRYPFPGNVRELENILERALTLAEGGGIDVEALQLPHIAPKESTEDASPAAGENLEDYLARIERGVIEQALAETRNNKTAAAKLLGITFRALRYKLDKLGMD